MITRTDVLGHLEFGAKANFLVGQKTYKKLREPFTKEAPSDGAFEVYADMGAVPWPRQNGGQPGGSTDARTGASQVGGIHEGGPITVLGGNERAEIVFNADWDVAIGIYHNAINDNRVGGLEAWAMNSGNRFEQHMDFLAFDLLNKGEAATPYGNGYDKLPLLSAVHIDPGAEYQTAQDNRKSLTLTLDNYETVSVAGSLFLDDRGQPASFNHTLLIHPPALRRTAAQITDNPSDYGTSNSVINPYTDTTRIQAPGTWLDSTAWFLIDPNQTNKPVNLQIRQAPQLVFWDDHSQGNGIRYYKWVARYQVFPGEWRLVIQGKS